VLFTYSLKMIYSSHTNIASTDDKSSHNLLDCSPSWRHAWAKVETNDEVIIDLQKKLLEAEHTREDQMWMKNEELFNMKMVLDEKEE
ncbi:hypothetical protein PENTCL1PPCAC_11029, partial [Pristionchus entomophagus]